MKKIIFLVLFSLSLYGIGSKESQIPIAQSVMIDLDPQDCNNVCLQQYLEEEKILSFLTKYRAEFSDEDMQESYFNLVASLGIFVDDSLNSDSLANIEMLNGGEGEKIKVALITPRSVIGKYSASVANSVLSYLIYKNGDFEFEVFDCVNENNDSILNTLNFIKESGYGFVIAPFTKEGAKIVAEYEKNLLVYIPTVNKNSVSIFTSPNIFFGGIDYKKQIDKLLQLANDRITLFNDTSRVGLELSNIVQNSAFENIVYSKTIENIKTNLKSIIKNRKINNSSVFLNMSLVKSSLIASQIRYYKIKPYGLYSTQVNYHPMILTLTQPQDRESFYIANSISDSNFKLNDINSNMGNNLQFNWIEYSTAIGMDFVYTNFINPSSEKSFTEEIVNNQVDYKVNITKPAYSSFEKLEFFD